MDPCLLPVDPSTFAHAPAQIHWSGVELVRGATFHLTVLGTALARMVDDLPAGAEIADLLAASAAALGPRIGGRLTRRCLFLRQDAAATIVQLCDIPELAALAADLRGLGLPVPDPVPHVTVYRAGTERGIAMASKAQRDLRAVGDPFPARLVGL